MNNWQTHGRWRRRHHKAHLPHKNSGGYIYILDLGYGDVYKIGKTVNIKDRLNDLQSANPRARPILAQRVKHPEQAEKVIHRRLKRKRVERECFKLSGEDLEAIRAYLDLCSPANQAGNNFIATPGSGWVMPENGSDPDPGIENIPPTQT